jgi:hypothetical protein
MVQQQNNTFTKKLYYNSHLWVKVVNTMLTGAYRHTGIGALSASVLLKSSLLLSFGKHRRHCSGRSG